ncbi:MAG: type II toxin-antitoxin system RelE/ParE family toxin [Sulfuricurvum sp.]|jgi:toxin ParE1/3/4|uniref:type II toxin-antitoxin system RelE/ParE family toxin n=1 Tax=Sulfuricurvum sp. TaxID=2025608 RepID=UPI0025F11802|nr:type II toxin-antitoxin system RelE/ParE family toxin [Sulfuricurvum sp.]MCK9373071.1 type II toxin-antitoxin system RelE/ParE family toxin [Sulfuricurvum sp.]
MPHNIVYLEHAYTDLEVILDHITEDSPSRAVKYLEFLKNGIAKLANFPHLGVMCKRKHIRRECRVLIIENYLVFYKTNESSKTIIIGRVLHRSINYKTKKLF